MPSAEVVGRLTRAGSIFNHWEQRFLNTNSSAQQLPAHDILISYAISIIFNFLQIYKMAAEKRPASNVFGSSQMVVKRQKSDANLNNGTALTVASDLAQVSLIVSSSLCKDLS